VDFAELGEEVAPDVGPDDKEDDESNAFGCVLGAEEEEQQRRIARGSLGRVMV